MFRHLTSNRLRTARRRFPSAFFAPRPISTTQSEAQLRRAAAKDTLNDVFRLVSYTLGLGLTLHITSTHFIECLPCYGVSMQPTFASTGDWAVNSKYYRRGRGIKVGDVVTFKHPVQPHDMAIKRIVGMPGDVVCRDTPGVKGKGKDVLVQVPEGHCWIAGDNLNWSRDSRMYGPLPLGLIRGKTIYRITGFRLERVESTLVSADPDDYEMD